MNNTKMFLPFVIICFLSMSFTSKNVNQKNGITKSSSTVKTFNPTVNTGVGPGPYDYSVSVSNADPDAVSVDVYIDFNGEHTNTLIVVPLSGGSGYISGQMSFIVAEAAYTDNYQYNY